MNIAVISVTRQGRHISQALVSHLPEHSCKRFCFHKHIDEQAEAFEEIGTLTASLFRQYDALIFICACGIAVRAIAPFLRSKLTDPAVLVMNDSGAFVIPILSGHIGGANALAQSIAERMDAVPVITTATDAAGVFSPDTFAAANDLLLLDTRAAKAVASAALDGETIGLYTDFPCENIPAGLSTFENCRTGICITTDTTKKPFPITLTLVPANIVLGLGCKRGISASVIARQVARGLAHAGIAPERVCAAATIDRKANDPGLVEFCQRAKLPLCACTVGSLTAQKGQFTGSDFVLSTVGVDNVCERSAVLCSGGGRIVLPKFAGNGVTVAAAEKPVKIDFARRQKP